MTTDMTGMKTVEDVIIGEPTNMQALFMVKFKPIYEEDDYFEEGVLASNASVYPPSRVKRSSIAVPSVARAGRDTAGIA